MSETAKPHGRAGTPPPTGEGRPTDAAASPTGAREALRVHIRRFRASYPAVLRVALLVAGLAWAAQLAVIAAAFFVDRATFRDLLGFVGITTVSGGQAAALWAFRQTPPLSLPLVIVMGVTNMVATLFLVVPLVWRAAEGLRDARFIGNVLMSAEALAARHRKRLSRWGLLGLGLVAALPVQGAGVLGAGALGVVMRIPLPRLLVTLAVVGAAVNVAWAVAVHYTASVLPRGGFWDLVPWLFILLVVVGGLAASRAGRREVGRVSIELFGWLDAEQRKRLARLGIRSGYQFMHVDLKRLARRLAMPAAQLGRCRNVAGLLRLSSLKPDRAVQLTDVGVARIRDLAVTPPALVQKALAESDAEHAPTVGEAKRWHAEAKAFVAETGLQGEAEGEGEAATAAAEGEKAK
jgi:uncharacterized membrane protein